VSEGEVAECVHEDTHLGGIALAHARHVGGGADGAAGDQDALISVRHPQELGSLKRRGGGVPEPAAADQANAIDGVLGRIEPEAGQAVVKLYHPNLYFSGMSMTLLQSLLVEPCEGIYRNAMVQVKHPSAKGCTDDGTLAIVPVYIPILD
jgi:hypothetical protein